MSGRRAPFQVLVVPYWRVSDDYRFALFLRADQDAWQWIAGGGTEGEAPVDAAQREAFEESGLDQSARLIALDSISSIPVEHFAAREHWGDDVHVIPEYSFGIQSNDGRILLSAEHVNFEWLEYDEAVRRATWQSNRTALWELNRRLRREEQLR